MNIRVILTAAAMFAGMAAPSFAFDNIRGVLTQNGVTTVTCDTRGDDKQAVCAGDCEDKYVRNKQNNMADISKLIAERKACDAKCDCAGNSDKLSIEKP